jgi:FlaA1/EpsC-like NDP-sugar epimerase
MGMTKAIRERVFLTANITCPETRFICVRYGNVLASRGSVIPMFHEQIRNGGPLTITTEDMTRFLLPLEKAVDIIFSAVESAKAGETYIPIVSSALMMDVARALIEERDIPIVVTGIRPGEKVHEILVSFEEAWRTHRRGDYYVIQPILPELWKDGAGKKALNKEYSSADSLMSLKETRDLLKSYNLMVGQEIQLEGELLS